MMNPGSSKPIIDGEANELVYAKPDKTQNQIIKLMEICDLKFTRILNLSDYREPKSKLFIENINLLDKMEISHSIFCDERKTELNNLISQDAIILFAWGVNKKLTPLAEKAFGYFAENQLLKIVGKKKDSTLYQY